MKFFQNASYFRCTISSLVIFAAYICLFILSCKVLISKYFFEIETLKDWGPLLRFNVKPMEILWQTHRINHYTVLVQNSYLNSLNVYACNPINIKFKHLCLKKLLAKNILQLKVIRAYLYSQCSQLDMLPIVYIVFIKYLLDMKFLPEISGWSASIIIQQT